MRHDEDAKAELEARLAAYRAADEPARAAREALVRSNKQAAVSSTAESRVARLLRSYLCVLCRFLRLGAESRHWQMSRQVKDSWEAEGSVRQARAMCACGHVLPWSVMVYWMCDDLMGLQ